MIRIALIAGAAAALGVKNLRQGKKGDHSQEIPALKGQQGSLEERDADVSKAAALEEAELTSEKTPALAAAESPNELVKKEGIEFGTKLQSAESPNEVKGPSTKGLERPGNGEAFHSSAKSPNLASSKGRISGLRLEIEQSASPRQHDIKAPPTPLHTNLGIKVREHASPSSVVSLQVPPTISTLENDALQGPLLLRSSSIRAPPTPSTELLPPLKEEERMPPQALRGVPRGSSRGPRVSVNTGLLDILPDNQKTVRSMTSPSPPPRSSFTEYVSKAGIPFISRSGGSTPVGSIRAPPTPIRPELAPPQGSPIIRAVPTISNGGVGVHQREETESSLGTSLGDEASVVISPIQTEREERVAQERMSLKDRWEAQRGKGDVASPKPSSGEENGHVETLWKGRQSSTEVAPDKRPQDIEAQLELRGKALFEIESQEAKRKEGLRVLEEREQQLQRKVAELEKGLEERRAADVARRAEVSGAGSDETGFDQARFDLWCKLRTGSSDATVHWYSTGELFSYPGGQLLAYLEGFEAVRARREGEQTVHELSRKLLVFVDKEKRSKLDVVRTAYQQCTYRLEGTTVHTEVPVGSGSNSVKLGGTAGGMRVMRDSDGVAFTRPTFLSIPSEKGDFVAFENHDFFTSLDSDRRDHFSMVRLGPVPGFQGTCFVHVIGHKLSDLAGLPAVLRDELEKEPLWKEAPEKVYF